MMDVKGFLLSNGTDREFLLTIQPVANGLFEGLVVREKVDGYWVDLSGAALSKWQERTRAIAAVLTYLNGLWDVTGQPPKPEL